MEKGINIIILEDLSSDAELAKRELRKVFSNPVFKVVDTEKDYIDALQIFSPKLIISDYQLPAFDGMSALIITKEKFPFIPFVILTGSMNEDTAVECMKAGADDYVIKEHLKRLGPAALNSIAKKKIEYEHYMAEISLKEREVHLSSILQNPVGYMIYRLKAGPDPMSPTVTHVSPSITDLTGVSFEESKNYLKWFENVHPDDLPRLIEANQRGMKPPFIFEEEFRFNHPKKGKIWLQARTNGIPYENDSENIEWAHGIIIDITKRKRSEQIQKILYNISNAAITSNNLEKLIIRIKEELETIIDTTNFYVALYDKETDTFSLPYHIDQKDDVTSFPADKSLTAWIIKTKKSLLVTKDIKTKLVEDGDVEIFGADSKVWLGVPLIVNGEVTGAFAVQSYEDENAYTDTDLRMLEFVSGQISIAIERKKAEDDLIMALEKAKESDRLKSAFLANMSHEIRTPMNGILGFTKLLKESALSGNERNDYIEIIERSGDRMLNTISNLMNISMIDADQMKIELSDIKLNDEIESLFLFFNPEVEQKGMILKLKLDNKLDDAIIVTDRDKFNSILINLLKNAIKYSHKGSIEFGYKLKTETDPVANEQSRNKELEFYVKDNGIGIPKNRQDAIFERFVQADIEDKEVYEGNGLGLSISKAYVEMLGGKIWLESEEGLGSIFRFTIPYNTFPKQEIITENNDSADSEPIKLNLKTLIVEDDETSEMLLEIMVEIYSKVILNARSGNEAIELCRNNPDTDLILMDIRMPGISGYEATQRIREFNKDVIIIAQTAYGLIGDREKALEAGCNDYITKPIIKDELQTLIQNYFK